MTDTYDAMPTAALDAFKVFATHANRSLNKTADLLDIPRGTVASWSSRYQWRNRVRDEDTDAVGGVVQAGIISAAAQHLQSITVAVGIRDDPATPALARLKAIEYLDRIIEPVRLNLTSQPQPDTGGATAQLSDLLALATAGNVPALVAIAQGRTPPALPAAAAVIDADSE